ncbi:MAG: NUDIX hydrolase [Thalassotalea sp.]
MPSTQSDTSTAHGEQQFKPNTTVAAVIHCQGKFLLVEEIENGQVVFNQPAGHLEADENLTDACKREVLEETGLVLLPEYLSGIYYYHRPDLNLYYLRFCYVVELTECLTGTPQDSDITTTHWFSLSEIKARESQLRSPMVLECVLDYLDNLKTGHKIPLTAIKSNL